MNIRLSNNNKIRIFHAISAVTFWLFAAVAFSQNYTVKVDKEPLNTVLLELRNKHNLRFSFDDKLLSQFVITLDNSFETPDMLVESLLKNLPLKYEKMDDVFVIYMIPKGKDIKYNFEGKVIDVETNEALPFSAIQFGIRGIQTDFSGNFSFATINDSATLVKVYYLGYYVLDTTLLASQFSTIKLKPALFTLNEVRITDTLVAYKKQSGNLAGESRMNYKTVSHISGGGDNSVFNVLRLQPGILAAGEQSQDLIVWGSYNGQSQTIYDGITLYNLKNFTDNISTVNPLMAKDIKINKGGFGVEYGGRVGAIVNISGIEGAQDKANARLSINSTTANGMVSLPIKTSALTLAYRKTYYNLTNPTSFTLPGSSRDKRYPNQITIVPEYNFMDFNLKLAGKISNKQHYHLSMLSGNENFNYTYQTPISDRSNRLVFSGKENNRQAGLAFFTGRRSKSGLISNLTTSFTKYNTYSTNVRTIDLRPSKHDNTINTMETTNQINDFSIKLDNKHNSLKQQNIESGLFLQSYNITLQDDSMEQRVISENNRASQIGGYVQRDFVGYSNSNLVLTLGMRGDYTINLQRMFLQPRASVGYQIAKQVKLNASYGIYNQFIAQSSLVDENENLRYFWTVCDNVSTPILNSKHFVAGISVNSASVEINAEIFSKHTDGVTRYIRSKTNSIMAQGTGYSKGFDLFVKKEFRNFSSWISYTLSKTEESFVGIQNQQRTIAPQDQRHEFKSAAIYHYKSFVLSTNLVFGSGLPDPSSILRNAPVYNPYQRVDIALTYQFDLKKTHFETGLSCLNLFNHQNVKNSNFIRTPTLQNSITSLYTESVPFTPTLYLNLNF